MKTSKVFIGGNCAGETRDVSFTETEKKILTTAGVQTYVKRFVSIDDTIHSYFAWDHIHHDVSDELFAATVPMGVAL